ncbi:protein-export chaperone SecB [Companilactobacillus formosensis]|uniref:protein-export chaperone SecB n=1 Tax=Companilactobacillus formosensis TaxID=1617889 RepID=UPI000E6513AE|nr:protein-export chaperone SecB [Companilactobacillus formosensis]
MNMTSKYLQFDNPTVLKFDFQVNDDFDFENDFDSADIGTLVEMPSEEEIDWNDDIPVYLTIFINQENDNVPYTITARIMTLFQVSELLPHSDALQLLQTDGASILLSYLRPMVSMMTSASGFPAMTLPILDFSDSDNN